MPVWLQVVLSAFSSVLAASGVWSLIFQRLERKDTKTKLLLGLGHDRIMTLGMSYIERGWITQDELENLYEYLYQPYEANGGNGSAKRIMDIVLSLPVKNLTYKGDETNG